MIRTWGESPEWGGNQSVKFPRINAFSRNVNAVNLRKTSTWILERDKVQRSL